MQRETAQRLASAVQRFFKDKHDVDVVALVGADSFRSALWHAIQTVYGRPESKSADEVGRAPELHRAILSDTIRALRALIMSEEQQAPVQQSQPQPEQPQQPQQPQQSAPLFHPAESADPEQAFFDRLQALETERRLATAATPAVKLQPAFDDGPMGQEGLGSLPAPIVVAAPAPAQGQSRAQRGRIVPILSMKRPWTYQRDRAVITWPGPLPAMSDASHVAIAAVLLPASLASSFAHTPFIILRVTGVGDAITECILVRGADTTWGTTFAPVEANARFIRPIPTPWTLEVLNWTGHRLDLGQDGFLWKEAESVAKSTDVLVTGSGQRVTLASVVAKNIVVADDSPVLNESRQWTVLLELAA